MAPAWSRGKQRAPSRSTGGPGDRGGRHAPCNATLAQMSGNYNDHMDWNNGSGWVMAVVMIVVTLAVVGGIIWAIVFASRSAHHPGAPTAPTGPSARESPRPALRPRRDRHRRLQRTPFRARLTRLTDPKAGPEPAGTTAQGVSHRWADHADPYLNNTPGGIRSSHGAEPRSDWSPSPRDESPVGPAPRRRRGAPRRDGDARIVHVIRQLVIDEQRRLSRRVARGTRSWAPQC